MAGGQAPAIDWLYALAGRLNRRIMVRLVKGAYWDAEIKRAQVLGLEGFPVFTRKAATDVSYIANASKLLGMTDRIYPQFATHNAHTVAAILAMAAGQGRHIEFQRLHGMGERLHDIVHEAQGTRCRIYAPVGAHRDLLAYLVRRLLENGANSSFVNQIVDEDVPPDVVAACPFEAIAPPAAGAGQSGDPARPRSVRRAREFARLGPDRGRRPCGHRGRAGALPPRGVSRRHRCWPVRAAGLPPVPLLNPADPGDRVGHVTKPRRGMSRRR